MHLMHPHPSLTATYKALSYCNCEAFSQVKIFIKMNNSAQVFHKFLHDNYSRDFMVGANTK